MQMIIDFLKSDVGLLLIAILVVLLGILLIINVVRLNIIQKNYKVFLNKLGNGNNIEDDIKRYVDKVENVEKINNELRINIEKINNNMYDCIQKIGIVRYTAYEKVGSDLSFALALLDKKNDGVVLNGIYSTEMSNIYAKPITNGKSTYTLSEQEQEAIQKAINLEYSQK